MRLTTHLHLMSKLRIHGSIPPLLMSSRVYITIWPMGTPTSEMSSMFMPGWARARWINTNRIWKHQKTTYNHQCDHYFRVGLGDEGGAPLWGLRPRLLLNHSLAASMWELHCPWCIQQSIATGSQLSVLWGSFLSLLQKVQMLHLLLLCSHGQAVKMLQELW
jgi:hypothetical protein